MDKFHRKGESIPPNPGNYWVVNVVTDHRGRHYSDSGFARWDGEKWSREDWDYWFN